MKSSPLDVVLCAGCGSIIPPENIVSEVWEPDTPPVYSFACGVCGCELADSEEPPATVRNLLDCDHPYDDIADEVDLGAFARAVVRQVGLARPVLPEEARLRALLGDLLAVIHRDGGHYVEAHGWEKACADAEALVLAERVAKDL
jgi:hypothetical protein